MRQDAPRRLMLNDDARRIIASVAVILSFSPHRRNTKIYIINHTDVYTQTLFLCRPSLSLLFFFSFSHLLSLSLSFSHFSVFLEVDDTFLKSHFLHVVGHFLALLLAGACACLPDRQRQAPDILRLRRTDGVDDVQIVAEATIQELGSSLEYICKKR